MLTQTQLKTLFKKYNFSPLKRFGENYLIDGNVKDKIITELNVAPDDTILEIGPGFGALTFDLAASQATVLAVEKDKKAFEILKDLVKPRRAEPRTVPPEGGTGAGVKADLPKLKIFNEDILKYELRNIFTGNKIKVVGNLPYYITTPVVEYIIENRNIISDALIVIQKEVALRLLAPEGSKNRSSISCFVQYYTKPEYLYTIKRTSFYPVPDVDSSLLKLSILEKPALDVKDKELFFKIIRGAFNQRRKSIINSLSREPVLNMPKEELSAVLKRFDIDPASRPEDLPLSSFASIANAIS